MGEIRTLRATGRGLETELWNGLRHQQMAKAPGQLLLPVTRGPPRQSPTLPAREILQADAYAALSDQTHDEISRFMLQYRS